MRAANSALSSDFCQVTIVSGSPASSPRKVSCSVPARFCGASFDLTTNQADWQAIAAWDERPPATGLRSASRTFHLPPLRPPRSVTFAGLEMTTDRLGDRAKYLPRKFPIHHRYLRRLLIVTRVDRPSCKQGRTRRVKVSGRNGIVYDLGSFVGLSQVDGGVGIDRGFVPAKAQRQEVDDPTEATPGMFATASSMRRCITGTRSPW